MACEIDWNLFSNAAGSIGNVVMAITAIVAVIYALKQLRESKHTKLTQVALAINNDIQNYRNDPMVRVLRGLMMVLFKETPDDDTRLSILLNHALEKDIRAFLARMNNLCWMVSLLPSYEKDSIRDNVLSTIDRNLIAEWDCLLPLIKYRRKQRKDDKLDDGNWYMKHFEEIVTYAKSRTGL